MPLIEDLYYNYILDKNLWEAVKTRDLNVVKSQFSIFTDWLIGPSTEGRRWALRIAFLNGDNNIVTFLLEHGANKALRDLQTLAYDIFSSKVNDDNSSAIPQSTVINIIRSCFTNPDFVKSSGESGFRSAHAIILFAVLLGKYNHDSEVIKTTFDLLEECLIMQYKRIRLYQLEMLEGGYQFQFDHFYTDTIDENDLQKHIRLKFLLDVYYFLINDYCFSEDGTSYKNSLSGLLNLLPTVDIFNLKLLYSPDEVYGHLLAFSPRNYLPHINILSQIRRDSRGADVVVDVLMTFNTYSLESKEIKYLIDVCLTEKFQGLPMVMKHLKIKPGDSFAQTLLKKYVVDNNKQAINKLLDFLGLACHFPHWKEIVVKSNLPDKVKQRFYDAEVRRNKCKLFANMAQTCKSNRSDLLSLNVESDGQELFNPTNLRQLSLFAVVHDMTASDSKILSQYQYITNYSF